MKLYKLEDETLIHTSMEQCWDFFSNPKNLPVITPEYLHFNIKSELPDIMYEGLIIEYTVNPIMNIPITWISEITFMKEPNYFVDEQRFGPYKFWHHEHYFKNNENGILMQDIVYYSLPFSFIGKIVHSLVVRRKLEKIFEYRKSRIEHIFYKH